MKYLIVVFVLTALNTVGQSSYVIKDNVKSDSAHKKYPSYIEIDSTISQDDLEKVEVRYNFELVKREGNRFYLSSKPFSDWSKTYSIKVDFPPSYWKTKSQAPLQQMEYSTPQFNRTHSDHFFQIETKNDSVVVGSKYEAAILIDTSKIKHLNKLQVFLNSAPLSREQNRYPFSFIVYKRGAQNYEITILKYELDHLDSIKFNHSVFGLMPNTKPVDYIMLPDKMPKFNSNEFQTFDDYFIKSIKKEKIQIKGKLTVSYTVMTDGSTRFEGIKQGNVHNADEIVIKAIVSRYENWTPGEEKGKEINVNITAVYDFE